MAADDSTSNKSSNMSYPSASVLTCAARVANPAAADHGVLTPAVTFRPACAMKDGCRQYQVLAVRINTADKPKLGIVLSVYRGALYPRKKGASSSVCNIVGAPLECEYTSKIHVCLLSLDGPMENASTSFHASCCSPVVVLDPMSEQGTVLGEISESMVAFRETRVRLHVAVLAAVVETLLNLRAHGVRKERQRDLLDGRALPAEQPWPKQHRHVRRRAPEVPRGGHWAPAFGRSGRPTDRWEAGVGRASPAGGRVLRQGAPHVHTCG
ncbi:unnamed protein product [Symbiodinium sp. CCMP2592]|nr:unnamed protein product [Symbiodinium sp. CCMP2592]